MKSADYKQGYTKGYNTGRKETGELHRKYHDENLLAAQRAERAEAGAGIGHCDGCANWVRPAPSYAWGYCNASRAAGSPWGCWAQAPELEGARDKGRITTSPKFGCVLFQPSPKETP